MHLIENGIIIFLKCILKEAYIMIDDGYASTLKKLITFTQAKFISLAEVVGYDVSYVNKWSNGTKLPSSRYVERINEEMGRYFSELIEKQKKTEKFYKTFPIDENNDDLGFEISQYLCAAYRATLNQSHASKIKNTTAPSMQVITGHHNTTAFLSDILQKGIQNLETDGELLVLGEFCRLYDAGFWKYFENIQLKDITLTIRVGLDMDRLEQAPKYVHILYTTLNKYLDFDFVFYDSHNIEDANLIILKDTFAVQYALSNTGRFLLCTYIFDEATVGDIYEHFSFTGTEKKSLVSTVSALGMYDLGYRTSFYATNSFFFFLTNGFEFLLPHEVFDSIVQKNSPEDAFAVQRLCVTWEEIVDVSKIDFIMPTTSLMRYIETGYIYITDVEYTLNAQERRSHIQSVLSALQKNKHISISILPTMGDSYRGENISFYSNYKQGFLKKNKSYIHNNASTFYVITNKRLHTILLHFFQSLKQQPSCQQYTIEKINQAYEKYKPLIERTLSLHE